jgi:hypothetical protein
MEEAPLQFIDTWNEWGKIVAISFILLAVFRLAYHFLKLVMTTDYKKRYDFITQSEISALWSASVLFLIGAGVMANSFISEIGIFWFIIRGFVTLVVGFLIGIVANNMLKFYYPFNLEKRLKRLRFKPRISPKSGKPMKLMSEEEEDVYLDEGMQAEENVFSIDYDVWLDEETGFTKIEKYSGHLHAQECPECGYQTFKVVKEEIVRKPTSTEDGELIKYYECGFCDHRAQSTHRIGQLVIHEDAANVATA